MMTEKDLTALLARLVATWENEVIEFKEAQDDYDTDRIGRYFSALANEANLREHEEAWLVFGVNDKTRSVCGSSYRLTPGRLQATKKQIADDTEPSITFRNIHEILIDGKRVVLFEIPAAPRGMPIAWKTHCYARAGESLTGLGFDKQDAIRQQTLATDWSAQVVPHAQISDLDETALQKAKDSFARKYANRFSADELASWATQTFLDRANLTQNGQITRATLLLLGKTTSGHLLSPHPAQMAWKLDGQEEAYKLFGLPFFLTTTQLYQKIRNIQIRLLPVGQLVPYEVSKYAESIVLEPDRKVS